MNPVTGLALGRIAVGVASVTRPDQVAQLLLLSPGGNSAQAAAAAPPSLLTQWFGTREIALGVLSLLANGPARRNSVLVGMAIDAADAATCYVAVRDGRLHPRLGNALAAVAAGAVVAGAAGLTRR